MIPKEVVQDSCDGNKLCSDGKRILWKKARNTGPGTRDLYLNLETGSVEEITTDNNGWRQVR